MSDASHRKAMQEFLKAEAELKKLDRMFPGHRIASKTASKAMPVGFLRGLKSAQGARKSMRKRGKRA